MIGYFPYALGDVTEEGCIVRKGLIIILLGVVCFMSGCFISRRIADLSPPNQPPLQELDQHLNYADPYAGRPDYIVHH